MAGLDLTRTQALVRVCAIYISTLGHKIPRGLIRSKYPIESYDISTCTNGTLRHQAWQHAALVLSEAITIQKCRKFWESCIATQTKAQLITEPVPFFAWEKKHALMKANIQPSVALRSGMMPRLDTTNRQLLHVRPARTPYNQCWSHHHGQRRNTPAWVQRKYS